MPKPKPGSTKRSRGSKKRQSAAKRQKKSNVEESPPSLSEVSQPVLKDPISLPVVAVVKMSLTI